MLRRVRVGSAHARRATASCCVRSRRGIANACYELVETIEVRGAVLRFASAPALARGGRGARQAVGRGAQSGFGVVRDRRRRRADRALRAPPDRPLPAACRGRDPDRDGLPEQGIRQDAVRTLLDYGFRHLNLAKVSLRVLADDERAVGAYRKAGFVEEGRLRAHAWYDGARHDELVMSVLRDDWKPASSPTDPRRTGPRARSRSRTCAY